ncbi:TonB-dependent hemoglobin/transferrin/lactoferrin family receptor [Polycladidibacter hongkongensis]|uniref:TonB-dependent hemoglobin/transferrin/lactoferrin family receptor n=1 Tax=Polycladidibacter hongkongensis TaxID=1647556 RepID=UPI0008353379|nr:TonB-dependent hemoglobin/transferrin/lactoferrin family receptor [Pseudovibrio hongkongensis]
MLKTVVVSLGAIKTFCPQFQARLGVRIASIICCCILWNSLPANAQSIKEKQDPPEKKADAATIELAPVVLSSPDDAPEGWQGAPEWVYGTPAAISVIGREKVAQENVRSTADLLEDVAGVAVADNPQDPGISINIRGLQDQNRVNVMIDGARQNFQKAGHASTGKVYIDQSFVRQIAIEKSAKTGVGGAGAIGGLVNFRSIQASDILTTGNDFGVEAKAATGTNAYNFNGNIAAAYKINDAISVVAGISKKSLSTYKAGKSGNLRENRHGDPVVFTGSKSLSWLTKVNFSPDNDHSAELSVLGFNDDVSSSTIYGTYPIHSKISNTTGTFRYRWNPESSFFDLKTHFWANRTHNDEYMPARSKRSAIDTDYVMNSFGGSLENISQFSLSNADIVWTYGLEAFRDFAETSPVSHDPSEDPHKVWFGSEPSGMRSVLSGFSNLNVSLDQFIELGAGLRYDYYKLNGTAKVVSEVDFAMNMTSFNALSASSKGSRISPEVHLAINPIEGIQLFGKYSEAIRFPTIMETYLGGKHIGSVPVAFQPNTELEPELAKTWEAGLNASVDSLLFEDDRFRLKTTYFKRVVSNYITRGYRKRIVGVSGVPRYELPFNAIGYVNLIDPVAMEGIEADINYDAGFVFASLGVSKTFFDIARARYASKADGVPDTVNDAIFAQNVPPETKVVATGGVRLLDKALELGARYAHVVPQKQLGASATSYHLKQFSVIDLFGSYKFNKNAQLNINVDNLLDTAYVDPMTSDFPSPGRTVSASLNIKF